jgi:hypothetical protein
MICKRCLYSDDILGVTLNAESVCNFCQLHDRLEKQYPISWADLSTTFERVKSRGKGHKYDCLVGISGGIDSTFMLHLCKVHQVRVLPFHMDNGFNTEQAEHNMRAICEYTGYKMERFIVPSEKWRKVNVAVLMAGVSDADIPNDIAMAKLMLDTAHAQDCPIILNGHSFRNEGSVPIGWTYMDGAYLKDMYRRYWHEELTGFPILTVWDQIKASLRGIKHERPLYHLGLTKEEQIIILEGVIDFKRYQGRHCENDYTAFAGWLTYQRFGIDKRIIDLSAQIRSGRISKWDAQVVLKSSPGRLAQHTIDRVTHFLSVDELMVIPFVTGIRKMFYEFHTYQKTFRRYRWLVKIGVVLRFLPETFLKKYCQKLKY